MDCLFTATIISTCLIMASCHEQPSKILGNTTRSDKDMYVIHATVYEVGILTNKTDNKTHNLNTTGTQESVTFFQTNGTHMDLGGIPRPLMTNVTAQSMVGVAPVGTNNWGSPITPLTSIPAASVQNDKQYYGGQKGTAVDSTTFFRKLFKRDVNSTSPIKITKGTAVIPPALGLRSISLPPLLSLNNNLPGIPVPIPNTAVVNYAKVNTLVRSPIPEVKVPL